MKKLTLALSVALAMTCASPAFASNSTPPGKGEICHPKSNNACAASHKNKNHVHEVPEIDAASAGLALALLGGILAIFRERRIRRQG